MKTKMMEIPVELVDEVSKLLNSAIQVEKLEPNRFEVGDRVSMRLEKFKWKIGWITEINFNKATVNWLEEGGEETSTIDGQVSLAMLEDDK
jgi:hypothetical protein